MLFFVWLFLFVLFLKRHSVFVDSFHVHRIQPVGKKTADWIGNDDDNTNDYKITKIVGARSDWPRGVVA